MNDANQLLIDHNAFDDVMQIEKLAGLVERSNFATAYTAIVVAELRAGAAIVTAMGLH